MTTKFAKKLLIIISYKREFLNESHLSILCTYYDLVSDVYMLSLKFSCDESDTLFQFMQVICDRPKS